MNGGRGERPEVPFQMESFLSTIPMWFSIQRTALIVRWQHVTLVSHLRRRSVVALFGDLNRERKCWLSGSHLLAWCLWTSPLEPAEPQTNKSFTRQSSFKIDIDTSVLQAVISWSAEGHPGGRSLRSRRSWLRINKSLSKAFKLGGLRSGHLWAEFVLVWWQRIQ